MPGELPFERPLLEARAKIEELKKFGEEKKMDFTDEIRRLEERHLQLEEELYANLTVTDRMQIARHPQRPMTLDYIQALFSDFIELHGDRVFGEDQAIVGGIAKFNGIPITVVGHQRGKDTKENVARYFGMPHPEGYRKALRLMQQADKFGRPIITFLDTKGAYPGAAAEERGIGGAIAQNLLAMAGFRVPIICIVIGEGESGGAIGIGVGNRVLMLEHAVYSVISPEGAAAILFKDSSKAMEAAQALKITSNDLLRMEVIEEIIPEPRGGAHRNPEQQIEYVRATLWKHLQELLPLTAEELRDDRYRKFRKLGEFGYYRELPDEPQSDEEATERTEEQENDQENKQENEQAE
jgi:acetyl-CoA carboxylase carboxyl transferase subunit alpha